MSSKKGEFLRDRAEKFLRNAKYLLSQQDYDLAAFNFEQATQLFLKFYLFDSVGIYPYTHSIEELLLEVAKAGLIEKEIDNFLEHNKEVIKNLEEAYITSRYLPASFFKEQVVKMERAVEELKKILFHG